VTVRPSDLIRLEEEYGSLEAAAEALPDQRDEILAAAEEAGRISERFLDTIDSSRPHVDPPPRPWRSDLDLDPIEDAIKEVVPLSEQIQEGMEAALASAQLRRPKPSQEHDSGGRPLKKVRTEDLEKGVGLWVKNGIRSRRELERQSGLSWWMVERMIEAIDAGDLEWDEERGGLVVSGQFPVTSEFVVVPRR
jgi:hypothetical protein